MIYLIRPPAVDVFRFATTSISMPIGLAYIAGALEAAGEKVSLIDAVGSAPKMRTRYYKGFLVGLRVEDIVAKLPEYPCLIGISVIFTHEWPIAVHLINSIKASNSKHCIVLGGEHITSMPEFCLSTSLADLLVLGEGEETIVEIAKQYKSCADFSKISGVAYRKQSEILINPRRKRKTEIDSIPKPAWQYFDLQAYTNAGFVGGINTKELTIPILATRGCPYQCTYCSAPNMWLPQWIARNPIEVVDEIERYVKDLGALNFPFQDLTAIIKKQWIIDFCKELLARDLKISWQLPTGTRSEAIDTEVARLLKQTGMLSMAYAPESGSTVTRKLVKKRMSTKNLVRSIRLAVAEDLNVTCFFVLGFPHDTIREIKKNIKFLKRIARLGVCDVSIGYYMALPGTELFRALYNKGKIKLDKDYFMHILDSQALMPATVYSDDLSRWTLLYLRLRLYFTFYSSKARKNRVFSLLKTIFRGLSGLSKKRHNTKLETVFSNLIANSLDLIKVRFKKPWLSSKDEISLFQNWDEIYRKFQAQKQEQLNFVSDLEFDKLQANNVIRDLRNEHQATLVFKN